MVTFSNKGKSRVPAHTRGWERVSGESSYGSEMKNERLIGIALCIESHELTGIIDLFSKIFLPSCSFIFSSLRSSFIEHLLSLLYLELGMESSVEPT
jgi:hypothetical protein